MSSNINVTSSYGNNSLNYFLNRALADYAGFVASDALLDSPFLNAAYCQTASLGGIRHVFEVIQSAGTAGFRAIGDGLDRTAAQSKFVDITLQLLDASIVRDAAVPSRVGKSVEDFMTQQVFLQLRAALAAADKQMLNGQNADANGFVGMSDYLYTYAYNMIDFAAQSAGSTVYMGRFGEDGVSLVVGNEGKIEVGDIVDTFINGANSKLMPALMCKVFGYMGLQVAGTKNLAARVNVGQTYGTNSLTDANLADLYAKFPAGHKPNFIVMGRQDAANLRKSRTATTPTGAYVPLPTEWEAESGRSIPIIIDDFVVTDTQVSTTTTSSTTSAQ